MISLVVIKGPDKGKRFELTAEGATIGRDARNTFRLHDSEISRHHAELARTPEGYRISDLRSSNGTLLNGERVAQSLLKPGDRIRLGQSELIVTNEPGQPEPESELARKINMISVAGATEDGSEIVRSIKHSEGSRFLRFPERAESKWLQDALSNLEILYASSKAISTITDIDALLEHILELSFKSIRADRGCIMLKNADTGELQPKAVLYAADVDSEENITLSQTIVDWVLRRNEGVIVFDAPHDRRFGEAASVVKLGIREAMCVPLQGRHDMLGVMYVDIKSDGAQLLETQQPTKFNDDHLKLIIAIAHQAGLAIEDSRFYQAMVESERLAAIGQTIAMLSHHIKNILQGVRAGSYVIEMGLAEKNNDMLKKGWGVVQKNQDKIYNLVMDMLSYSKEREPVFEAVDLNRLVAEVAELMQPRARELDVRLDVEPEPSLPRTMVDPEAIHRAVLNVVTNAIDAAEDSDDGRVTIHVGVEGEDIFVAVVDNGIGIPEDRRDTIFQIFHSTKGSRGSGLGLAVSKKIAEEHEGSIEVTSELGQGSRFTIRLPLREPPSDERSTDDYLRTFIPED